MTIFKVIRRKYMFVGIMEDFKNKLDKKNCCGTLLFRKIVIGTSSNCLKGINHSTFKLSSKSFSLAVEQWH